MKKIGTVTGIGILTERAIEVVTERRKEVEIMTVGKISILNIMMTRLPHHTIDLPA